ncbi:MAG: acyl homoserine lactone synthase [Motiliproteus sp.]|jgi:acyl homoserine lactone synthase
MDIIFGSTCELSTTIVQQLSEYRYRVFIEALGWELKTESGIESDQFDREDTQYVVARNDEGHITGCARLLHTISPYLLEEVFPQLLNGMTPPKSTEVWELSRFTTMDLTSNNTPSTGQFSSNTTLALLDEAVRCAKQKGAKRLISVSPIGVERLLRNTQYRAHRAGPPMIIDGYPLVACWIDFE